MIKAIDMQLVPDGSIGEMAKLARLCFLVSERRHEDRHRQGPHFVHNRELRPVVLITGLCDPAVNKHTRVPRGERRGKMKRR